MFLKYLKYKLPTFSKSLHYVHGLFYRFFSNIIKLLNKTVDKHEQCTAITV